MTQIVTSNKPGALSDLLNLEEGMGAIVAVVEAEYGDVEVFGSSDKLTLNHHLDPERLCPCLYENFEAPPDIIGISHFDLDTLGGILALLGKKPDAPDFWSVAAFVDTHGPHKVTEAPDYSREVHQKLMSWWKWSKEHRLELLGDEPQWVDDFVAGHLEELLAILNGERDEEGERLLAAQEQALRELEVWSWQGEAVVGDLVVVTRSAQEFVNHLYSTASGDPADVVVGLNTNFNSITLSCSDGQIDCCDLMQEYFGSEAGGHAGIAGTPRDKEYGSDDLRKFQEWLEKRLGG